MNNALLTISALTHIYLIVAHKKMSNAYVKLVESRMQRKLHVRFGGESLVSKGLYPKGRWLILHNQLYNSIITAHAILMRCDLRLQEGYQLI